MNEIQVQTQSPEMEIATRVAEITTRPDFLKCLQEISQYEVQVANVKVTNVSEEAMAVGSLAAVAKTGKCWKQCALSWSPFLINL